MPFKATKVNVEEVERAESKLAEDVEELQAAVENLSELFIVLSKASQDNSFEVLEYLWQSIAEIIKVIGRLNKRVRMWKLIIGDFEFLREDKGAQDISSEISNAFKSIEMLELAVTAHLNDVAQ
jgi:hypothetical protein